MNIFERSVESVQRRGFHDDSASEFVTNYPLLQAQFVRLVEEVGEVGRAMRKDTQVDAFGDELADVVIVVAQMAYCYGLDLERSIERKLQQDEGRGYQHRGITPESLSEAVSRGNGFDLESEHNIESGNHPGTMYECHQ